MRKKCIALFAALTMVFSLAPVVCAQAAPAPSLPSEHTFYLYDEDACLYIYDLPAGSLVTWWSSDSSIADASGAYDGSCSLFLSRPGTVKINCSIWMPDNTHTTLSTTVKVFGGSPFKSIKIGSSKFSLSNNIRYSNTDRAKVSVKMNRGWTLKKIRKYSINSVDFSYLPKSKKVNNNTSTKLGKYGTVFEITARHNETGTVYTYTATIEKYYKKTITVGKLKKNTSLKMSIGFRAGDATTMTIRTRMRYDKNASTDSSSSFKNAAQLARLIEANGFLTQVSRKGKVITVKAPISLVKNISFQWINGGNGCKVK